MTSNPFFESKDEYVIVGLEQDDNDCEPCASCKYNPCAGINVTRLTDAPCTLGTNHIAQWRGDAFRELEVWDMGIKYSSDASRELNTQAIEDTRALKAKLEEEVGGLLTDFSQETGIKIEKVDIEIPNVIKDSLPVLCYKVKIKAIL